jgi:hypothetical protein
MVNSVHVHVAAKTSAFISSVADRWVQVSVSIFVCQPLRTQAVVGLVTQHVAIYRRPHTLYIALLSKGYDMQWSARFFYLLNYFWKNMTAWDRYAMRASLCFYLFIFGRKNELERI